MGACQEPRATGCKPSGRGGFHADDVLRLATFERNAHAYYATHAAPTSASFCLLISSEFKKARSLLHDQPTLCRHRPCASRSHLPPMGLREFSQTERLAQFAVFICRQLGFLVVERKRRDDCNLTFSVGSRFVCLKTKFK